MTTNCLNRKIRVDFEAVFEQARLYSLTAFDPNDIDNIFDFGLLDINYLKITPIGVP